MAKRLVLTEKSFSITEIPVMDLRTTVISILHKPTGIRVSGDTLEKAKVKMEESLNDHYDHEVRIKLN